MVNSLYFITDQNELNQLENEFTDLNNKLVISFFDSYKFLTDKKIPFRSADEYLSSEERLRLFDKTTSLYNWHEHDKSFEIFNFNKVNLFGLIDTAEFHRFLLEKLKIFFTIKNILDKENPKKIYATKNFAEAILAVINNVEIIWLDSKKIDDLYWDSINLKFHLFSKSISLKISRRRFNFFRNLLERFLFSITQINKLNPKKKSLLFLEFDPITYSEIFENLNDYDGQIIMFNRRRPLFYNIQTLKNLQKAKYKILDRKLFLNSDSQTINNFVQKYTQIIDKFCENDPILNKIFSYDGISFWNFIKTPLLKTYRNRIQDYIENILISKKLFEQFNIRCIISLNVIGETEKIILNVNQNIHSIMLEHAYANYVPEISRFDFLSMYPLFPDKIAVWGLVQKEYLIQQHKIDSSRILEIGSPRHDQFFNQKILPMHFARTILITIHPVSNTIAMDTHSLYIKFENVLTNLINLVKKLTNVKILVKLHPIQIEHNKEIERIIKQLDPKIELYHTTPIMRLLLQSDFLINVSSEGFDPSTVILEALILKRPTMNIIVDEKIYDFQFLKDNAVFNILYDEQFQENLHNFIYDIELQKKLVNNGTKHVDKYLINRGSASNYFAEILKTY